MKYFYADRNNQPVGPYELDELRHLHVSGVIRTDTLVIEEGGSAWKPFSYVLVTASGTPPPAVPPPPIVERKSKLAAGLFGIFLGTFGVHNFYLGYTGKAMAQLLITLLSCLCLSPISSIWGLIEGIMILAGSIRQDATGNPLGD